MQVYYFTFISFSYCLVGKEGEKKLIKLHYN